MRGERRRIPEAATPPPHPAVVLRPPTLQELRLAEDSGSGGGGARGLNRAALDSDRACGGGGAPRTMDDGGVYPMPCGAALRTMARCLGGALRFIQQFGPGRPQRASPSPSYTVVPYATMVPHLFLFLLSASSVFRIAESCSSRSTPKPRGGPGGAGGGAGATMRPNITFQTYACPEAYAKWYCLNGATCFAVKIRDSILYNCECADGYMGQRCEFKDLDGSYLPSRERVMIERASIAGGVSIAVLLVALISLIFYVHTRRRWRRMKKLGAYYPESRISHLVQLPYPQIPPMDPDVFEKRTRLLYHPQRSSVATISRSPILLQPHQQRQ